METVEAMRCRQRFLAFKREEADIRSEGNLEAAGGVGLKECPGDGFLSPEEGEVKETERELEDFLDFSFLLGFLNSLLKAQDHFFLLPLLAEVSTNAFHNRGSLKYQQRDEFSNRIREIHGIHALLIFVYLECIYEMIHGRHGRHSLC